jgi:molybdopterin molybdotransferase
VPDTRNALIAELDDAAADVIITTGSTSMGPRDHLREVLRDIGAHWLVDGVAVRPGHPMLLARLTDDRYVVGLPGNPLAAVAGLVTLAAPLIRALRGLPPMTATFATLLDDVTSHPHDTRLMPVALSGPGNGLLARPLRFDGPAMLRSLAEADALVVIAPGAGQRGSTCEVLPLPTPV